MEHIPSRKLTVSQLVKKFPTSHCLDPDRGLAIILLDIHFNIIHGLDLYLFINFHLQNLMSKPHSFHRSKGSVPFRDL
jgi:hypothetical protein